MASDRETGKLTAKTIRQRLGLSTAAIPVTQRLGAREIGMIREAGITRIEICGFPFPAHFNYRDARQVSEITTECRMQGISIVSAHGPGLQYDCPYENVRRAVVKEAAAFARVVEEMGASIFIDHFTTDDYSRETICEMLDLLAGSDIRLAIENGETLKEFADFVDSIGSERFGMCVDIGHARDADGINPFLKKERVREVMAICEHRLFHIHLHGFTDTDHYPPFDGNIQWGEIFSALQDIGYTGEFMFEVARVPFEETLKKIATFPEDFVERYGDQYPFIKSS